MARLLVSTTTAVESDSLAKVAFKPSTTAPISQRADLLVSANGQLVPAVSGEVNGLSILQELRALIGDGSGATEWVRVRQSGASGDNEDSYANLRQVGDVAFAQAPDGEIARLRSTDGAELGEVHLPKALEAVRNLGRV
jgi:hypothetical protein